MKDLRKLKKICNNIRFEIIKMCNKSKSAHLASSLSCVDILVVSLWKILKIKKYKNKQIFIHDKFIVSKGHAAMAIYSTYAERGFFPKSYLKTYNKDGGFLAEHPPANILPGIDVATGSLGHGLPIGAGYALGCKIKKLNGRIIVVMSDGELNEGSNWEAALFASANNLNNLTVVIDHNKWQATDRSSLTLGKIKLQEKRKSFGWHTININGHNLSEIYKSLIVKKNKPIAIIADTIKGKGVSFMEDDNNWHYRVPNDLEVKKSKIELGVK